MKYRIVRDESRANKYRVQIYKRGLIFRCWKEIDYFISEARAVEFLSSIKDGKLDKFGKEIKKIEVVREVEI